MRTLNSWILARLEALMARSPISPYAIARFLAVGTPIPYVADNLHSILGFHAWSIICAATLPLLVWGATTRTDRAERENSQGRINSLKFTDWPWRLAGLAVFFFEVGIEMQRQDWFDLAFVVMVIGYQHFQAINWVKPAPRSAEQSIWETAGA